MVDGNILRLMAKTCPNYHVVANTAAKVTSVCPCSRCTRRMGVGRATFCGELYERLKALDYPVGYSRVDVAATCDRAVDQQMTLPFSDAPDGGGEVRR